MTWPARDYRYLVSHGREVFGEFRDHDARRGVFGRVDMADQRYV
jgi:hypothetical protein